MTYFILLCLLGAFIRAASSITCYNCNPLTQFTCGSDSDSSWKTCDGSTCFKAAGLLNGRHLVVRGCVDDFHPSSCFDTSLYGVDVTLCGCSTPYCNTGPVTRATAASNSLTCHKCDSKQSDDCSSLVGSSAVASCTGAMCWTGSSVHDGNVYVVRGCYDTVHSPSCNVTSVGGVELNVCTCDTSCCNNASFSLADNSTRTSPNAKTCFQPKRSTTAAATTTTFPAWVQGMIHDIFPADTTTQSPRNSSSIAPRAGKLVVHVAVAVSLGLTFVKPYH